MNHKRSIDERLVKIPPRYLLGIGDFESISEQDLALLRDIKSLIRKHRES